ncbi:ribosome biogenesis GTP-binding protein YihA/YsxC [Acuticoccus sp. MNP-M23]|uniref:ribosome biogenesis GTP-binding protein YihA/YsxC n=1 Tax=Acuticoccus sp. MNP-M23 TaxID=3072793 RepID=UPI0028159BF6|nr:ribosome biogenesis GTP-binding protein YihA/YsxC [Acuticoccus sp. MNP-M23]WMS42728.1 ribosome biogenesis GTP-binding protein YihA/YsxC [Acuticoccus sp. MNP-M23]
MAPDEEPVTGAAAFAPPPATPLSPEEAEAEAAALEAGRLLFAAPFAFQRACHAMEHLLPAGPPEVAFAGRSNVGKSTLLNALTGQKGLAKASNTPGRTRSLNIFARDDGVGPVIVDMPGYGYAKAPKADVAQWTRLVFDYLRGRPGLRRVYLLIDARHGLKAVDEAAMDVMDEAAISYQAVLTKADKTPATEKIRAEVTEGLRKRAAAHPVVLATSAAKGGGIAELRAAIFTLTQE